MHRLLALIVLVAIWSVPVLAHAQDEAPTSPDENYETVTVMAMTGEPEALSILGRTFEDGWWGVTPDAAVSVRWHTLAAEQGNANSQKQLGIAYGLGRGVLQDYEQAYKWFALAGLRLSGEEFTSVQESRDMMLAMLKSPSQLAASKQLARDWRPLTFDEAKEAIIALPPLDANCGDAWVEMVVLLFDGECLPN